jgi:D-amino-acid dehydrogenase
MRKHAIVIGAGVIGLATAYFLSREGLSVTILDQGLPGGGCSHGNMGWVCPSLSGPLPSPGIVGSSLKGMLDGTSPLYIKPSEAFRIWPWLISFWRHANAAHYAAGLEANLWLNRQTLVLYDQWVANGVFFEMHNEGLLYVFRDAALWNDKMKTARHVADYGFPEPEPLVQEAILDIEPDLSPTVVGGILLPQERHVRADTLIQGLVQYLKTAGVEFRTGIAVEAIDASPFAIRSLQAGGEQIQADVFVLTAGVQTGSLARRVGLKLPVIAGKGYSLTFMEPNLTFRHPLYLGDTKVAVSPYSGALRVGGTMEFSGPNTRIDARRVESIRAASSLYFRAPATGQDVAIWAGLRPMTPDGLPIIGRAPRHANLYIATGHGSDGVFMAPATASLLCDMILDRPRPEESQAFDPGRFS